MKLHILIANPQSPTELSKLLFSLSKVPGTEGAEVEVVFEKMVLQIADLADELADSVSIAEQIAASAKARGIESATAMIGLRSNLNSIESCSHGMVYIGSFVCEE